jgi:hypothetical protein
MEGLRKKKRLKVLLLVGRLAWPSKLRYSSLSLAWISVLYGVT